MGRTKGSKNISKKTIEPVKPKDTAVVKEKPLKVDGVTPRKEAPPIPVVLVDGGYLYRFLLELRRNYDEFITDGDKAGKKKSIEVIDMIMDYIMRMEKKT
jgi:hypothetical protein